MLTRIYLNARLLILTVAAIVGVVSIVAFIAASLFSVRPLIVVSGSMEPAISTGSLLFAADRSLSEVSVGDIVTVDRSDGHGLITHRIIAIEHIDGERALQLQGDANTVPDPTLYTQQVVGAYLFSVPGAGAVAGFFQNLQGLLIAGAVLLVLVALSLFEPSVRSASRPDAPVRPERTFGHDLTEA